MDNFGTMIVKNRKFIEMPLIFLILVHFAPTEVLGSDLNTRVRSMMGPLLTPVNAVMGNIFVRTLLWAVLLWACCATRDMNLFFLVAIYFVVAR